MTAGKNGRYGARAWPGMRQIPQISMDNTLAMHSRHSIFTATFSHHSFDSTVQRYNGTRQHSHSSILQHGKTAIFTAEGQAIGTWPVWKGRQCHGSSSESTLHGQLGLAWLGTLPRIQIAHIMYSYTLIAIIPFIADTHTFSQTPFPDKKYNNYKIFRILYFVFLIFYIFNNIYFIKIKNLKKLKKF